MNLENANETREIVLIEENIDTNDVEDDMKIYPLQDAWSIYVHDRECREWDLASYNLLGSYKTVKDMWCYMNSLQDYIMNGDMFMIMKGSIEPIWEAPENKDGGSVRIVKRSHEASTTFEELMMSIMGRTLFDNQDDIDSITGISIVCKRRNVIFKIWTSKIIDIHALKWSSEFTTLDVRDMEFMPFVNP